MRWGCLLIALLLLPNCSGISADSPDQGSPSSETGAQGGAGANVNIWSNDSSQSTLTHQNSSP
jgi:hypothetical protein